MKSLYEKSEEDVKDLMDRNEQVICYNDFWFNVKNECASSRAIRARTYCSEDPRFETHFEPMVGRSLTVHSAVKTPGGNTGEIKIAMIGIGCCIIFVRHDGGTLDGYKSQ